MAAPVGPLMERLLTRYGLEGLAPWLSNHIASGTPLEEIELELYDKAEFINRFPAIRKRLQDGKSPVSVDEYLEYEKRIGETAKSWGAAATRSQVDALIANDVSMKEAEERLSLAGQAVHMVPLSQREQLQRLYGISTGELINYWLDPKQALPVLQKRFAASQIADVANRSGWGDVDNFQAERLVKRGMDAGAAEKGFGALVDSAELFARVDAPGEDLDVEDQLDLISGDQGLVKKVEREGEKRAARFGEGGEFSTGRSGVAGLGSANK